MSKMIVIDGLDGSGKATQAEILTEYLKAKGYETYTLDLPFYSDASSTLVKMYLGGEFGKKPGDVNAYAASLFYAVDRFASYKTNWGEYYNQNGVIVSGRYTTSNAVHQTSKMDESEWKGFLDWLYDLEYNKVAIPKPDKVIFLDMPIEVSQKLLSGRYNGDEGKKDIHESDTEYLNKCRKAAMFTAEYSGWTIIPCAKDGEPRLIEEIAKDVLEETLKVI